MKIKENILGIAELLTAAVLTAGSVTFFKACGAHEGKFMACHWAQNTVTLIGAVLILSALLRIVLPNKGAKAGLALSIVILSVSTAFIPNKVINLCMMDTMRCHTVFKPSVIIIAALLAAVALADTLLSLKKIPAENEHPKAYA